MDSPKLSNLTGAWFHRFRRGLWIVPPLAPTVLILIVLALAILVPGCGNRNRGAQPPDVLLITVDTLRADHVGAYGEHETTTPNMDALAAEGTLFENARSPLPETRPSHFTLFTSQYPREHGVLSNLAFPQPALVALPSLYRQAGYQTAAVVGCGLFDQRSKETLGFDLLDTPSDPQRAANVTVPRALEIVEGLAPDRPFFLWLHLFDPHMPYQPPSDFDPAPESQLATTWPDFTWPRMLDTAESSNGLSATLLDRARQLYRGEVEHADHWLGVLVDALRQKGRWEDTMTVLTADHGECFSNGIFFDHSQCTGEGALAIPLILRYPNRVAKGRRVSAQVELLDIAPTLLRLSGLEVPGTFRGQGLLAKAERTSEDDAFAFFESPHYFPRDVRGRNGALARLQSVAGTTLRPIEVDRHPVGARSGPWKYLVDEKSERLINLSRDPGETTDLSALESAQLLRFRAATRQWMNQYPRPIGPQQDPESEQLEQLEQLESLGYF